MFYIQSIMTKQLTDKVYSTLKENCPRGCKVVVAVSGGADSIALADCAARLSSEGYFTAYAMHIEHGIRGSEALRDADYTQEFCLKNNLPFKCVHKNVPAYSREMGLSMEAAARELRYKALQQYAGSVQADFILTAHHGDDQAETVLLKLLRGASAAGLGGMQLQNKNILRPFISLSRKDLEAYCRERNIAYCHDSSNDDVQYTRNKVRLELLPYLEQHFNAAVKKTLLQTAELLREDEDFIEQFVEQEAAKRLQRQENCVCIDTYAWQSVMPAVRKRLLRYGYFTVGGRELNYLHTEKLDRLCLENRSGRLLQLPQKINAYYAYEKVRFSAASESKITETADISVKIEQDKEVSLGNGKKIRIELVQGACPKRSMNNIVYPLELLADDVLTIRTRRAGDRFYPYGGSGSKKLKDYFIDKKITRDERARKLLVCSRQHILGIFTIANGSWQQGDYKSWLNVILTDERTDKDE